MSGRKRIQTFLPKIINYEDAIPKCLASFSAGDGFREFDEYLKQARGINAQDDRNEHRGVTHLIIDESTDEYSIVAYFTIACGALPYDDGYTKEDDPALETYPAYSAIELKMFAVDEDYQDVFWDYESKDLPIAAWCLLYIIGYMRALSDNVLSAQVIYLHSIPSAEYFYLQNSFTEIPSNFKPLFSVDNDLKVMYLWL